MKRFWVCLIALLAISCTKSEDPRIPYREVYLELDLNFEDKDLLNPSYSKTYTKQNISAAERAGFGGVIVYFSPFGNYVAYDLACPYEASSSTLIKVEEQGDLYAICPDCKSKYELASGYPTAESVSKYPLHPYRVSKQSSSKLIVQH